MIRIGKHNTLKVIRLVPQGAMLDAEDYGDVLLPKNQYTQTPEPGDRLQVFLYVDSKDRVCATCQRPLAEVDSFAWLTVKSVNNVGAFIDWGLPKDLLVPYGEMYKTLEAGKKAVVHIMYDAQSERLLGSTRIIDFLNQFPAKYKIHQQVELMIFEKTDIGYRAIINDQHLGMIYQDELEQKVHIGDKLTGYIKKIRPDGRVDLSLKKGGLAQSQDLTEIILKVLDDNDGVLAITDKSSPQAIKRIFGVSKKVYKNAIGQLYKARKITLEPNCIKKAK